MKLSTDDLRKAAKVARDATDYWHAELFTLAAAEIERLRTIEQTAIAVVRERKAKIAHARESAAMVKLHRIVSSDS